MLKAIKLTEGNIEHIAMELEQEEDYFGDSIGWWAIFEFGQTSLVKYLGLMNDQAMTENYVKVRNLENDYVEFQLKGGAFGTPISR